MRHILLYLISFLPLIVLADVYTGRVLDEQGQAVMYATVYLEQNPAIGTATNHDGYFELETGVHPSAQIMVSFLGYEKQEVVLQDLLDPDKQTIILKEQPIALEETVIEGKKGRQKNRRKKMQELLYQVYNRMQYDFPDEAYKSQLVSDVSMTSENQPWGMEQMIATIVNVPASDDKVRDNVLFAGDVCKRYFDARIRSRANDIYNDEALESDIKKAAYEVDSGVVVHRALWKICSARPSFAEKMSDVKHWSVSKENDGETVLTHTEKHNYMGFFKIEYNRHFIINSDTYSIERYSVETSAEVSIPFGFRLKGVYLDILNLLNMDNRTIERFRLRRANGHARLNTLYQTVDGKKYPLEKNLSANAILISTKRQGIEIPVDVKATQRVTRLETHDFTPLDESKIRNRIVRQNVPVY